jgi:hypothetical protein
VKQSYTSFPCVNKLIEEPVLLSYTDSVHIATTYFFRIILINNNFSLINGDSLNKIRRETSRHFRKKKRGNI